MKPIIPPLSKLEISDPFVFELNITPRNKPEGASDSQERNTSNLLNPPQQEHTMLNIKEPVNQCKYTLIVTSLGRCQEMFSSTPTTLPSSEDALGK